MSASSASRLARRDPRGSPMASFSGLLTEGRLAEAQPGLAAVVPALVVVGAVAADSAVGSS